MPDTRCSASWSASCRRLFLPLRTSALPRSPARIFCIDGEGMPPIETTATTLLSVSILEIDLTSSFFHGATWADFCATILDHLLGGAHRRLEPDALDAVAALLELGLETLHENVDVLRDLV